MLAGCVIAMAAVPVALARLPHRERRALGIESAVRPNTGAGSRGTAARGWASLSPVAREAVVRGLGRAERSFHVRVTGARGLARGAGLSEAFAPGDVAVRGAAGRLALGLTAIGRAGDLRSIPAAKPSTSANLVTYAHPGVSEWYANTPVGLEQGFDVTRRPAGDGALALTVGSVSAGRAALLARGSALVVAGLRYGALSVTDAAGDGLPARIALAGDRIRLIVDDAGASYPLHIDPLTELAELSITGDAYGNLGESVSISSDGTTIVAGASNDLGNDNAYQTGDVYVFTEPVGGWGAAANPDADAVELVASDGVGGDVVGRTVAISPDGSTIVAGAPEANDQDGALYIWSRPSGGWSTAPNPDNQTAEIDVPADRKGDGDSLGADGISLSDTASTLVAGVGTDNNLGAWVYTEPGGGWKGTKRPNPAALLANTNGFNGGESVAISSDAGTVVSGEPQDTGSDGGNPGAAYVYTEPAQGWAAQDGATLDPTAILMSSDNGGYDGLGSSVAVSANGSTIAAGAPEHGADSQGAEYVFTEPGSGWGVAPNPDYQAAELDASDPGPSYDFVGTNVAISSDGNTVAGGVPLYQAGTSGAAYDWVAPAGGWDSAGGGTLADTNEVRSPGTGNSEYEQFGASVALGDDAALLVVGAPDASTNSGGENGAVYVYGTATSSGPAKTSTTVTCTPATILEGKSSTTCTAHVTDTSASPTTPTGTVTVSVDGAEAGVTGSPCTLSGSGDTATCTVTYDGTGGTPGVNHVSADYSGNETHKSSIGHATVHVDVTTTTTVRCSPSRVTPGQTTTCTATVTGASGATTAPSGTVTFSSTGSDSFSPASCTLTAGSGTSSSCQTADTPSGTGGRTIKAHYNGASSAGYRPSTGSTRVTVATASVIGRAHP